MFRFSLAKVEFFAFSLETFSWKRKGIPTLVWLFLLCCFFEQKARKVKGEVATPPFLCSVCYSTTHLTFHPVSFSSKSFGPLPPPPPPIQNVSVGMRIVVPVAVLFVLFPDFDSAHRLLIAPPYLMRGNDSVFFSPQLKHYRQTHSFIIWGETTFFPPSKTCRDSVFCSGLTPLKRCFAIFWDRRSHRYQKEFGIYSVTVGNMINFCSNKRKTRVSYRLYFSTLLVAQFYL